MNETRAGPSDGRDRPDDHTENRGAHPLTRPAILAAALDIIDRDSIDRLSMRRLSNRLGHHPTALYRHAANKAALLDGVNEFVLEQLTVDSTDPDWRHQLRLVARDFRRLAVAHPRVVPLLVTRPLATPLGQRPPTVVRPLEDMLALLTRADFSGSDALHIYRAVFGFLYGHILNEVQEIVDRPEETTDLLRLGLHHLPIGEFPLLRGLASQLAAYDGVTELERGLDALLAGLATTIRPATPRQKYPG
ncbi:TetR/AcrR family transcriptional regulator C-terminal domain-containing protein [Nocardia rhamnosiphila]|uniref:TetR/AcrR family transcriptional regulator C-terminal domain-containing protein n=1 Tax=Nocardia rhamnosiphila TaxID=426716 RepID=UPI0037BD34AF